MTFYIFHRHRVCLVDRVDLICSLYSWWEAFGSSSLVTLSQGYNCGFISTSGYGSSIGVCSWGCPEGLGFAPVRARCRGSAAAWVTGVLAGEKLWWWGERGYGDGYLPHSWLNCISLLPWLPTFLHRHFPPQSPSSHSLDLSLHSQQQPLPWDCSPIPKLQLPATMPSRVCMTAARAVWFSFHLGCFPLSLKCFSSDSDNCPDVGIGPLLQVPHPPRAGPVLLTLPFFPLVPSSYRVLHGSINSFLLIRCSCPLSAGVLHAVLCLKVYSWCIRGERCTPRPPTPLPSCSSSILNWWSSCQV